MFPNKNGQWLRNEELGLGQWERARSRETATGSIWWQSWFGLFGYQSFLRMENPQVIGLNDLVNGGTTD